MKEEPFQQIRLLCGLNEEPSPSLKEKVGTAIQKAYLKQSKVCPPPDIMDTDYAEIDITYDVGLEKRRKLTHDPTYVDDEDKNLITPKDIENMKKFQSHLWPIPLLESGKITSMEYLFNEANPETSTMRCTKCYHSKGRLGLKERFLSTLASAKGMLKSSAYDNEYAIINHQHSTSHMVVDSELKKEKQHRRNQELGMLVDEDYQNVKTNKHLRLVYNGNVMLSNSIYMLKLKDFFFAALKQGYPSSSHTSSVLVMIENGVDMGKQCYSRQTFVAMTRSMSKTIDNLLIDHLRASTSPLSLILDSSTSHGNDHYLVTLIQSMEKHIVVNYFYGLIEIPMDESSESLKKVLIDRLIKDGLYQAVKDNIVGFVSDSAPVMVSLS